MIGKTISHYKILEKIGGGGMGVVYKAEDTKLKRTVALKFLPHEFTDDPVAKKRFIQEAQSASSMDHPNICSIHEIDETDEDQLFIAMACYEGETLKHKIRKGPLEINEAMTITLGVAQGLAKAHSKGIVHRDIKPANVFITTDRQVKILDFGLAKLASTTRLTRTESITGTAAYMSPEMVRSKDMDHRTDIWSLGVVLYEMLTGQLPFKGENWEATMFAISNNAPIPMNQIRKDIPESLERIVTKMLQKKPQDRHSNIQIVAMDLQAVDTKAKTTPFHVTKPSASIAVLPFLDISLEKDQEYFCDGIAEELINSLTHIKDLRVVARTSAFSFKGKDFDVREIGRTLNVDHVLEGSVRKAGNQLRITAQLINVIDGYHIWSERYDRDTQDIFALQDEISLAIVGKLKMKLFGEDKAKVVKRHTDNLEAYNLYLLGRYSWYKERTEDSIKKAIEYFKKAVEKDPKYALAYAGIAECYNSCGFWGFFAPRDSFPIAIKHAQKALEIDESLSEAHTALAMAIMLYNWDWVNAEKEFKRAIELYPNDAYAHYLYGTLYLLANNRYEQAIAHAEMARDLDPLSPMVNMGLAATYFIARQISKAVEECQRLLSMEPNFMPAIATLSWLYAANGMCDEAIEVYAQLIRCYNATEKIIKEIQDAYTKSGFRAAMRLARKISPFEKRSAMSMARNCAFTNDVEEAFDWLKKSFEEREPGMIFIKVDPSFDDLHSDSRFIDLLKKMHL